MAACDNLYGNREQWQQLHDLFLEKKPEYLKYMHKKPSDGVLRICYVADIQKWLYENAPWEWIKSALEENFIIQKMICGRAHHEWRMR